MNERIDEFKKNQFLTNKINFYGLYLTPSDLPIPYGESYWEKTGKF